MYKLVAGDKKNAAIVWKWIAPYVQRVGHNYGLVLMLSFCSNTITWPHRTIMYNVHWFSCIKCCFDTFCFYTSVFGRDVLWYVDVCPSVSPSVSYFFRTFILMLWHIELKFCTWLCFRVLRIKIVCRQFASFFAGFVPLLELRILSSIQVSVHRSQFSALFSHMLWHIELKFCIWLSSLYYRSSLIVVNLCQWL